MMIFQHGVNTGMEYYKLGNVCMKRRADSSKKDRLLLSMFLYLLAVVSLNALASRS